MNWKLYISASVLSVSSAAIVFGLVIVSLFLLYTPAKSNKMDKPKDPSIEPGSAAKFDTEELRERLTPEQYRVTQHKGTEAPFTGEFWNHHEKGMYRCVVCGEELFTSESKFDSGCGWPSFDRAANDKIVGTNLDTTHGMVRDEIVCTKCGAHLGHVFPDGPTETGLRYCVNSASLSFDPKDDGEDR
jgi:peptide-methionine (R)-S-oxide reductase